jgi:hypothetical protein
MLSLRGDQINTAYEQVFGHDFDFYELQQSSNATRSKGFPRPPRPPKGRKALQPHRPTSNNRAQFTTAATAIYQRRASRKRAVFFNMQASLRNSASSQPSKDCAGAATPAVSREDEDGVDEFDSISSPSDLSDSPHLLSGTCRGEGAAPQGDFLHSAASSAIDLYYKRPSRTSMHITVDNAPDQKSRSGPPPPLPPAAPPAVAYTRPLMAAPPAVNPKTQRLTAPSPSHGRSLPPQCITDAPRPRSAATSVFDRLAGDAACGTTTLGRRLLSWARGAELTLHPSPTAWMALHLHAMMPLRHERLWRRACAKARHQLSRFASWKLGAGGEGSVSPSGAGSREQSVTHPPIHIDPHHSGSATRRGEGNANTRVHRRPSSSPTSTPGSLRAYRCREEYKRWCYWQMCHFYELGSKYLTSVWRMSPLMTRGSHSSGGSSGAALGAQDVSATAVLAGIFDGRYVVPCAASIDESLAAYKAQDRRAQLLLRLLMREGASCATLAGASYRNGGGGAANDDLGATHHTEHSHSGANEEGEGDDEAVMEDEDVYRDVNESRRSSEAVAATEPFFNVRLDTATGLLHLSLYVNGDEGGNGADFVGASVAACLDNHRWVVLKGLWAREVLVFHFHRPSLSDNAADGDGSGVEGGGDTCAYKEEEEQRACRRSQHVDGFVVKGVAFTKVQTGHASASAQDSFLCCNCGHLRSRHNDAYISKRTGRLARGYYYCALCRRRTHHVRLPPMESLIDHVEEVFAASVEQDTRRQLQLTSNTAAGTPMPVRAAGGVADSSPVSTATLGWSADVLPSPTSSRGRRPPSQRSRQLLSAADVTLTAKAMREWTRAAAAAPRPAWQSGHKLNSDDLFGRPRRLDCPPSLPHY